MGSGSSSWRANTSVNQKSSLANFAWELLTRSGIQLNVSKLLYTYFDTIYLIVSILIQLLINEIVSKQLIHFENFVLDLTKINCI